MKPKQYIALRNAISEFLGTATLVYFTNFVYHSTTKNEISPGIYGLIFGLILSLVIYFGSTTSGGLYDPAITINYLTFGKIGYSTALPYIFMQLLGSLAASIIMYLQLGEASGSNSAISKATVINGAPLLNIESEYFLSAFVVEIIAVVIVHLVRLAVLVDNHGTKVFLFFN